MRGGEVRIVEFDQGLAPAFAALNYEWIAESYEIEPHDREILDDPYGAVIAKGGQIFFALDGEVPVGTVAMIDRDPESFELCKMAVAPNDQGRGIGKKLLSACVEYAKNKGKKAVVLESNTRQSAAIHLYRAFGFADLPLDPNSAYKRANVRMRLALS